MSEESQDKSQDPIVIENIQNYITYIRTTQASTIRTLSESLKEVLTDTNIYISSSGLKITATDNDKNAFIHLKLDAKKFQNFYCPNNTIIGVNLISLHKLLKTINNSDIITLFIEKKNENLLGIRIENFEKKVTRTSRLKLIDIDVEPITIPEVTFDSISSMSCVDFQKHCRDLSQISENVKIYTKDDNVVMCAGTNSDFAEVDIQVGGNPTVDYKASDDEEALLIGEYSLKYLSLFCKSSSLCRVLELYLKESYALIVVYSVSDLGKITYGLSPRAIEDN
ncbi:MAG: Heterosigma akashiwo virus 01 [Bacteroidota bacterium]|jgi:proliferating cell nuclear antigen